MNEPVGLAGPPHPHERGVAPELEVARIRDDELARLARYLVDLRVARAPLLLVPYTLLALWRPTELRLGLLACSFVAVMILARLERDRFLAEGFSLRFLAFNAAAVNTVQLTVVVVSGNLESPLISTVPLMALAAGTLLGATRPRLQLLAFQLSALAALVPIQISGLAELLAPPGMAPNSAWLHTTFAATVLSALTIGASVIGVKARELFDLIQSRTGAARQDLLRAHQEQTEELGALAGTIAHELKNPLASVKGLAALLARDLPEGKSAERLAVLRREVDRMQGVLEEFLNFSRPASPLQSSMISLDGLLGEVAAVHEGLARDRAVKFVLEGRANAWGDGRKVRQILNNLVLNALDVAPSPSVITLRCGVVRSSDTPPRPGQAWVEVLDEGPGLSPQLQGRLFMVGVTTKPRGSGLGLVIARTLARQQGGELTLENRSRERQGSTESDRAARPGCVARLCLAEQEQNA